MSGERSVNGVGAALAAARGRGENLAGVLTVPRTPWASPYGNLASV